MTGSFFVLILCPVAVLAQTLVFTNGPTDTTACIGNIAIISCGFENVSNLFVPDWRIIKRSDDGSVISDATLSTTVINSDDNDGLHYINDLSSGMNTSPNSRLLVGPVDDTDNQSSYQCIFNIGLDVSKSSIGTLTVTGIPAIDNLNVTNRCTSVTASWDITEGPCRDLPYNVTLSSSDGVTLGPFITNDTAYNFTTNLTINGDITVNVFAFNENAMGGDVIETADIEVSSNDLPTATNIRNVSRICVTSFNISWDASNSTTCGVVFYNVSLSPPPIGSEETIITNLTNTFYHFTGLNNSLPNVMVNVTASNNEGEGEVMIHHVQLPKPMEPPPVENLTAIRSDDDIIISWDRPDIDNCTTLPITYYGIDATVKFGNLTQARYMVNVTDNNMDRFSISYNEHFDVNVMHDATYNISVSSTCDISLNTGATSIQVPPEFSNLNSVVSEISAAIYLICVVICYPLSMAFIYCIIKILKEDAYDREYKEPGCCALIIFGIMSLGIAPLIYLIWKMRCRENCKEEGRCCKKECCCGTMIVFLEYICLALSFGMGYLIWTIYNMECWCCKGQNSKGSLVKPDVAMEEIQSDLYASPGTRQEHSDNEKKTEQDQAVYSYARTGPINVVMPGSQQQQQPEPDT